MLLNTASHAADWITLDLTGLFMMLACWALGLGYAVAALTFGVFASLARTPSERARQIRRALLCVALAPGFGLLLPLLLGESSKASLSTMDTLAIFWAPTLATVAGLAVRRVGRKA